MSEVRQRGGVMSAKPNDFLIDCRADSQLCDVLRIVLMRNELRVRENSYVSTSLARDPNAADRIPLTINVDPRCGPIEATRSRRITAVDSPTHAHLPSPFGQKLVVRFDKRKEVHGGCF